MSDNSKVINNFEKFINKELQEKLADGLTKACLQVEADAKLNCPVRDGQLRQSITHEVNEETLEGVVGTAVEYAPYVEIGTGIYSLKGDGRKGGWLYKDEKTGEVIATVGQHPQPFLENALESNKTKILEYFEGLI